MNKQSQQFVIAGVVAFLTSGVITLAGLSAAQDAMHMDGGMMQPPPGGDSGTQQQFQPMDSGTQQQQFQPMDGYHPMDQGAPSMFQGTQENDVSGVKIDFQRDGANFQKDGAGFQRDGMNFQKDGQDFHRGAPDFGEEGARRGFRGDFGEKTGAEHEGGRFDERKPMGDMRQFGGRKMRPDDGNEKVEGGLRTFDPRKGNFGDEDGAFGSRFGDMPESEEGRQSFFKGMKGEHEQGKGSNNAFFDQYIRGRKAADDDVAEEDLNKLDEVLADDEGGITAEDAFAALKDAAIELKELQVDLKDAKSAVTALVKDDKKLDSFEAQVEKKYGDVEDAPASVATKVEDLTEQVTETKENIQSALAGVDSHIEELVAQIQELKGEIQDADLKQESKLIGQCDKLLQGYAKVDTQYEKLEAKVEHVDVGEHGA